MDLDAIVQSIDEEIDRLQRVRALLTGHTVPLKRGMPSEQGGGMSAEGRAHRGSTEEEVG
jgi:hypothetical protein